MGNLQSVIINNGDIANEMGHDTTQRKKLVPEDQHIHYIVYEEADGIKVGAVKSNYREVTTSKEVIMNNQAGRQQLVRRLYNAVTTTESTNLTLPIP